MASGNNHEDKKALWIRAVVLDYGEVLCFDPEPETMGRMAGVFQIEPEHFLERYIPTRGPYDQGALTAEEYWRGFARDAVELSLAHTIGNKVSRAYDKSDLLEQRRPIMAA